MKPFEFLRKLASRYLLGNLIAMALVVVAVCLGVRYGLDIYTHHGEKIMIPDVRRKSFSDASYLLEDAKLKVVVSDTGYVPGLPPDCILEQTPASGEYVKSGHIVYLVVNATSTPTLTVPDVIDNSSLREAMAKLSAMGSQADAAAIHRRRARVGVRHHRKRTPCERRRQGVRE